MIYAIVSIISNTDLNKYCILGIIVSLFILSNQNQLSIIIYWLLSVFSLIIIISTGLFKTNIKSIKYSKIIK